MQTALDPPLAAHRRPASLELIAAGLLAATVVLHVVAMIPAYFIGTGATSSIASQPDQAALYSVLAASWALALAIGLTGPHRTPVAAALATGVAATELGFRVSDLGDAVKFGSSFVGAGLWLMEAAWVVGAAAAVVALIAVRRRHGVAVAGSPPSGTAPYGTPPAPTEWQIDWATPAQPTASQEQAANPYAEPGGSAPAPDASGPADAASVAVAGSGDTAAVAAGDPINGWAPATPAPEPAAPPQVEAPPGPAPGTSTGEDPHERAAWTMLVAVLALVVAGAFLPAWDHAVAYSTVTGQGLTRSLGNAFSGPWQQVTGTVLAALALAVVPIVAIRLRNRLAGAAAVCGALLVLATQFTAAVIQVDQPVSPSQVGLTTGDAARLGLQLTLKLTGWFTVDALAAYALFAAVLVWATLRVHHENSPGTHPSAPDFRREAIPWAS